MAKIYFLLLHYFVAIYLLTQPIPGLSMELPLNHSKNSQLASKYEFLKNNKVEVYLNTGYRRDKLDWSIAATNGSPNIQSELTWKDVESHVINVGTVIYLPLSWMISLDYAYGHIFNGKNQDSDFSGNNRTSIFAQSNNGADTGSVYDISGSIGYRQLWNFRRENHFLTAELRPQVGISYHVQNLKIVDGLQTIPTIRPIPEIDSSYNTEWFGPWVGLNSIIRFNNQSKIEVGVKYHYTFYNATANWNLRPDFMHPKSFVHQAEGDGFVSYIKSQIRLSKNLGVNFSLNYKDWSANKKGTDKVFLAEGSSQKTKLNSVNWTALSINIGLSYLF